jgi:hypothetical protein
MEIKEFLDQFRSQVKSADDPFQRAQYWLDRYSDPQTFYPDANAFELRIHRRNARQNLRRLLNKYPGLLERLQAQIDVAKRVMPEESPE